MTMDLSWYPQPVSTLSSGISYEQHSAQHGLQAAAISKNTQESYSHSYRGIAHKGKRYTTQENPQSINQPQSRQHDRPRRPLGEITHTETSSRREASNVVDRPEKSYSAGLSSSSSQGWTDIDELNKDNLIACSEYANTIFDHLRESQATYHPNPYYMTEMQHDVNPHMRAVLADWLIEVSEEYRLCSDTLWLTFNFLDRFLSKVQVSRGKLQLAGVTSMWVAAKYEEIYAPNAGQFCYITDNTYSKEQLVTMEEQLLAALDFRLTAPTVKTFLRRWLQACVADEQLHYLASYIAELSLLDHRMLQYMPAVVAAAAVYLARTMLRSKSWNTTLQHYTQLTPVELQPCAAMLLELHKQSYSRDDLVAVKEKYSTPKYHHVSKLPPLQFLPAVPTVHAQF